MSFYRFGLDLDWIMPALIVGVVLWAAIGELIDRLPTRERQDRQQ